MKKILVTGGAGFLGSHLCEELLRLNNFVICLDNLHTGSKTNISHLLNHDNFEFVFHDVVEPLHLKVDEIYNLACPASPVHYQISPVDTVKTAVLGAINMLELAERSKARILQASTSEIYGDPERHPQQEHYQGNVNPIGPRACYDEGKRCAETLFFDFQRQFETEIKVVRIFNTYGPKMQIKDGRVISNFIVQALSGKNITIYGNGLQTRSFCYVDDLVSGLIKMMESEKSVAGPINLGNPTEYTIQKIAEIVIDMTGSNVEIEYLDGLLDDPSKRCPDISKARNFLGWEPRTTLIDGLPLVIDYFKEKLRQC